MAIKKIGMFFFIFGLIFIGKAGCTNLKNFSKKESTLLAQHNPTSNEKQNVEKNMINLGDFEEKNPEKYIKEKWNLPFGKGCSLTTEAAYSGRQSLKIIVPSDSKKNSLTIYAPFCKVEEGKEYKVTFWAKAVEAAGGRYVLFPNYYFYKDDKPKPKYLGRVIHMIQTPTFDWQKIERIVRIPEGADLLRLDISTRATMGDIYIDDAGILPVTMSTREARKERAYSHNKSLDTFFKVSEELETPHIKWLKPYAGGKINVLYLSYMSRLDDTNKRDLVELNQRLDINYKFIPLLNTRVGKGEKSVKGLESYIIDVASDELKKEYDVIVINHLDFKNVQEELIQALLSEVKGGKGMLLIGCKNISPEVKKVTTQKSQINLPNDFDNMPIVNQNLKDTSKQVSQICKIWQLEKGKIATINESGRLYPSVPELAPGEVEEFYPNFYGREIPYWEYKFFPIIKSILYLSGRESDIKINKFTSQGNNLKVNINAKKDFTGLMEVSYKNKYGQQEKKEKYSVTLKNGDNDIELSIPKLSGGYHLSDYRLMDNKGQICDFGSYSFNTPVVSEIKEVKFPRLNPCYKAGENIKVEVELNGVEEGTSLSWYIEDTYNRVPKQGSQILRNGQNKASINFLIDTPLSILHRLFVKLESKGELLNLEMREFSMPYYYLPTDELMGMGWFAFQGAHGFKAWKENGFDQIANGAYNVHKRGGFRSAANVNMRLSFYGLLSAAGDVDKGRRYYADKGKEGDDVVRKPCYSDPDWWANMKKAISERVKDNEMVYYGIKDYPLGDESFLGTNVCYSEWCLKDFREYLKKEYKDLNELNSTWVTNFKSWEEVVPVQRKETSRDKNNMAAWLDHKMFMTTVFARIGGRIKNILEEVNPGMEVRMGFTGMQNPGYSYNWNEITKHLTFLRHYSGMQIDLIRSLAQPGTRYGQPVGYAAEYTNAEKEVRHHIWRQLFNQANTISIYYMGYALLGDLSFAKNTKYTIDELLLAKQGIDKMLLSSEMICDIGLHYSHSSVFANTATIGRDPWSGAIDSWIAIINDLGLNFKFVSYEQLEKEGISKDKYKVFVLPVSVSLSDKEIDALSKYVETGGVLIADYGVGIYDSHGKKRNNRRLLQLFGIEREKDSKISFGGSEVKISGNITEGLTSREVKLRFGERGIKPTTGKVYGVTGEETAPAVIINRYGNGKAILLNCVINDYSRVVLSGGGEISEVKRGLIDVNEQVKGLARDVFSIGGATPEVLIRTDKGLDLQSMTKTSIWKNGNIKYVGLLNKPESMRGAIKPSDKINVDILLKDKGHLYDVLQKKYLGEISGNQQIKASILPSRATIYAILPYRVSNLEATTDKLRYNAGETIKVSVNIKSTGRQLGNHVAYMEVYGPDGKKKSHYTQKVILEKGEGKFEIPTAFNDLSGRWSLLVRDVASGESKKIDITLTALFK